MNKKVNKQAVEAARWHFIEGMVEYGDLVRIGPDYFEDMGGHGLHESNISFGYFKDFFDRLEVSEKYDFARQYELLRREEVQRGKR